MCAFVVPSAVAPRLFEIVSKAFAHNPPLVVRRKVSNRLLGEAHCCEEEAPHFRIVREILWIVCNLESSIKAKRVLDVGVGKDYLRLSLGDESLSRGLA